MGIPREADLASASIRQPGITILAVDGREIVRSGDIYGDPVELSALPPHLPQAVLATEDRRFYQHFGIDPLGVLRALVSNLRAGAIRQGGSTITQQVAKNLFLKPDRTLRRKIQEAMLAIWLEANFSKDQILAIYLNRVYFGAGTYGVNAAALRYFGKPARDVDLFQAAVLAGLPKAPSRYNPRVAPERAAKRARIVLDNMVDAGWLSRADASAAKMDRVATVAPGGPAATTRYFGDWIIRRTRDLVGVVDGDLIVKTTLDRELQTAAEGAIRKTLGSAKERNVSQGALVALTPTGAVRALAGGRDWHTSAFNRATQASRQPGSAFKPVVYLAALESGFHPSTKIQNVPLTVEGWTPDNGDGKQGEWMTMREGLARSSNSVAVVLAQRVGGNKVIDMARRLGITAPMDPVPSLPLGVYETTMLELASAYAVMANGGREVQPYGIVSITDGAGEELYRRDRAPGARVVGEDTVRDMNDMLGEVLVSGTGKRARLKRPAAGKTGTTQDYRDAWFVGYTASLVTAVWVGNDDGSPMKGVTGGSYPAAIWKRFMQAAHRGQPARALPGVGAGG